MEVLLTIIYTLIFLVIIYKVKFYELPGFSKKLVLSIFIIKVAFGIALYIIYTYYYKDRSTADIFKYFDDSKVMYDSLYKNPLDYIKMLTGIKNDAPHFAGYYNQMNYWFRVYESNIYNDSHTIIRFNAFIRIFSFGFFNVHTVFMSFFSLTGLVALYKFAVQYFQNQKKELVFAIFLLPSVLFWGSGVLKEGILLFGMGLLIYYFDCLIRKKHIILSILLVIASGILLTYTKFYVIITLIPLLISYWIVLYTSEKLVFVKYFSVCFLYIIIGLLIPVLFPGYNFLEIITQKQHDFINLSQFVKSGSVINVDYLEPNLWSFIKNAPIAFSNTLLRPMIFEAKSLFMALAAAENLIVLILGLICIFFFNRKVKQKNFLMFSIFYVVMIFTLTGLITPVMGAIVRYKIPALPFLVIIIILLTDKEKLIKRFNFLSKIL